MIPAWLILCLPGGAYYHKLLFEQYKFTPTDSDVYYTGPLPDVQSPNTNKSKRPSALLKQLPPGTV